MLSGVIPVKRSEICPHKLSGIASTTELFSGNMETRCAANSENERKKAMQTANAESTDTESDNGTGME